MDELMHQTDEEIRAEMIRARATHDEEIRARAAHEAAIIIAGLLSSPGKVNIVSFEGVASVIESYIRTGKASYPLSFERK